MGSNKLPYLFSGLIFILVHSISVLAVTDAELDALEKQLKQQERQETQRLQNVQDEKKRKDEAEAEANQQEEIETDKKRRIELDKQSKQEKLERQRREEEQTKEREALRLIKEEQSRKEREEKIRAELEKKAQYENHINKAAIYMENENYSEALAEYNLLLVSFPNDAIAIEKIKIANALIKSCTEIAGRWQISHGPVWTVYENNTADGAWLIFAAKGEWDCLSAKNREFFVSWPGYGWVDYFKLSEDANRLTPIRTTIQKNISGYRVGTEAPRIDDKWKPAL